jgi:hypothetical protein
MNAISYRRMEAFALYIFRENSKTEYIIEEFIDCMRNIKISPVLIPEVLIWAIKNAKIDTFIIENGKIFLKSHRVAVEIINDYLKTNVIIPVENDYDNLLKDLFRNDFMDEHGTNIKFEDVWSAPFRRLLTNNLSIINGFPGTGKSTKTAHMVVPAL